MFALTTTGVCRPPALASKKNYSSLVAAASSCRQPVFAQANGDGDIKVPKGVCRAPPLALNVASSLTSHHQQPRRQPVLARGAADGCGEAMMKSVADDDYTPVFVMLPLDIISMEGVLNDPVGVRDRLNTLKQIGVDGVMVDVWWGIVEKRPREFKWTGYEELFEIIQQCALKVQVVMSFHECGGNVGDDVNIPLPSWINDIGKENGDIYFTDSEGRRNSECLTIGIDNEPLLVGRTPIQVYMDYMESFRSTFQGLLKIKVIVEIQVGLGPCGELRYPAYPAKHGWDFPGIGQFQCFDRYLRRSLTKWAQSKGRNDWANAPEGVGNYNSSPEETAFFQHGGEFDGLYGRGFLSWYSKNLLDHGDKVLSAARNVFGADMHISAKVAGIHWWYKTTSHAAELTAGYYNVSNQNGYSPIIDMLGRHQATLNFTCLELSTTDLESTYPDAMCDPEGLVWKVLNTGWEASIPIGCENALPCYSRGGYDKIIRIAKIRAQLDTHRLSAFTYLRLGPQLLNDNLEEFRRFILLMHGGGG